VCRAEPTGPTVCDADGNGVIDWNDLYLIMQGRSAAPVAPGDPRDGNGDGYITVLDARVCVQRCTNGGCR
jgi:hypothetical protein